VSPPEKRRRDVVELVTEYGGLSVERLAEMVGVSESTVRRDLRELANRGLVERTHGGAVPVTNVGGEPSFTQRAVQQLDEKQAIARRAVEEIQAGQVVYFDSGTTTMQVAREAPDGGSFAAVTNSPLLTLELGKEDGIVKSVGGDFRGETKALVGPKAESYVRSSNFDLAFVGTNGVDANGALTAPNEEEANLKRLVIDNATRTVVVAVTEKFGERSFRQFGTVADVDLLITDGHVPDAFRDLFATTELLEECARW
jgi:DeoR family fructose operon transcriptional repressor